MFSTTNEVIESYRKFYQISYGFSRKLEANHTYQMHPWLPVLYITNSWKAIWYSLNWVAIIQTFWIKVYDIQNCMETQNFIILILNSPTVFDYPGKKQKWLKYQLRFHLSVLHECFRFGIKVLYTDGQSVTDQLSEEA